MQWCQLNIFGQREIFHHHLIICDVFKNHALQRPPSTVMMFIPDMVRVIDRGHMKGGVTGHQMLGTEIAPLIPWDIHGHNGI